jgi:glycosyltransferase involved in cell wall biosynthesis
VVTDQVNGLLCKIKDSDDLAEKMGAMATMSDRQLEELGSNGRKKMEREYNENVVIEKYLQALATLQKAS